MEFHDEQNSAGISKWANDGETGMFHRLRVIKPCHSTSYEYKVNYAPVNSVLIDEEGIKEVWH